MYCPNCGAQNDPDEFTCKACHSMFTHEREYAGFWRRYGALIPDFILMSIFLAISSAITYGLYILVSYLLPAAQAISGIAYSTIIGAVLAVFGFCIPFLYFPLTEWAFQATVGKMLVSMIVVNKEGKRISIVRAFLRLIGKAISVLILGIGFYLCGFTEKRQGLDDMIAGTYVVMKTPRYFIQTAPVEAPPEIPAPALTQE